MDIKITKSLEGSGYDKYKVGDKIENAELIFGDAQARYLVETGHAEPVNASKTEKAVAKTGSTPE